MPDEDLEFQLSPEHHERLKNQAQKHGFCDADGFAGELLERMLDSMPIPHGAWMGSGAGHEAQRATVRFSLVPPDNEPMEEILRD